MQQINRGPDLPPITDDLILDTLKRIRLPNWLAQSRPGTTCDNCNGQDDLTRLILRELTVTLCVCCLEEACAYAQP